ncbi:MAG: sensor domain-containing diguanylate cyclase [Candidatus Baltobacteraceae bacterium]|jgi:diguanylate cyclase (GGDEF)-like protein
MPYRDNIAYSEADAGQIRIAWSVAIAVLALSLVAVPFGSYRVGEFEAFAPAIGAIAVCAELLTVVLLLSQYRASLHAPLGALTLAYAVLTLLDAAHLLAMPHFLNEQGLAGEQTAPWLYFNARGAFLVMVLAFALAERSASSARTSLQQRVVAVPAILVALYAVGAVLIGARYPGVLPAAMTAGHFLSPWQELVAACILLLNLATLIVLGSLARQRRIVHLWLAVGVLAMMCETFLTNLSADTRYSLGWFFSRIDWFVATSALLLVLLYNTDRVLRRLTARNELSYEASVADALTGLLNRDGFMLALDDDLRRAQRAGEQLSLLMIDVDDFKRYNDELGEKSGDSALVSVADVIRSMLGRPGDSASRVGGEEFAVLLPETDEPGAIAVAERIRRGVERRSIVHGKGARLPVVTVSIGVASTDDYPTSESSELCLRAEAALYGAKAAGRNCVRVQGAFRGASAETRFAG